MMELIMTVVIMTMMGLILYILENQRIFTTTSENTEDNKEEIHYYFSYTEVPLEDINLRRLRSLYKLKEAYTIKLIEEKFEKNEMSYFYFMDTLQRSHNIFYEDIKEVDALYKLRFSINYYDKKVNELKKIVREVEGLMIELAENKENIDSTFIVDDLRHLKDSVKNYRSDINE